MIINRIAVDIFCDIFRAHLKFGPNIGKRAIGTGHANQRRMVFGQFLAHEFWRIILGIDRDHQRHDLCPLSFRNEIKRLAHQR